jgi:hypothetical protein
MVLTVDGREIGLGIVDVAVFFMLLNRELSIFTVFSVLSLDCALVVCTAAGAVLMVTPTLEVELFSIILI